MGLGGWRQHYYDAEENEPASAALPIEAHVEELRDGVTAEIRAIFSLCVRDTLHVTHCSTMKRLIVGDSDLRQRIRAAREKNDGYERAEDAIASEIELARMKLTHSLDAELIKARRIREIFNQISF